MSETVLVGRGKYIVTMLQSDWQQELEAAPETIARRLDFMSPDHHAVREFVVRELPRVGRPISLDDIARGVALPREIAAGVVRDLERNLFFLARREGPDITWAFPVTVDETPHHLRFSTGERLDAA